MHFIFFGCSIYVCVCKFLAVAKYIACFLSLFGLSYKHGWDFGLITVFSLCLHLLRTLRSCTVKSYQPYVFFFIYIYIVTYMTCCFLFLSNIYQWKAASVWIMICHLQFWVTVWFVVKDECQKRYVYGNSLLSCMMILTHFVAWSCDGGSDWQCILVMGNYKDRNLRWLQAEFHFSSEGLISSPDWGAFSWALARL